MTNLNSSIFVQKYRAKRLFLPQLQRSALKLFTKANIYSQKSPIRDFITKKERKSFVHFRFLRFTKTVAKGFRAANIGCAPSRNEITFPFYVSKIADSRMPADTEPIIRSIKRLRWFFSTEASREGDWLATRNRSRYRTNFFKSSATRMYRGARGSESILNYDTSSLSTWVSAF